MRCFDGHCDTLARCMTTGEGLRQNGGHVDLARCAALGQHAQIFAVFADSSKTSAPLYTVAQRQHALLERECARNADLVRRCRTARDVRAAWAAGKTAALLGIEGAELLECDPRRLDDAAAWECVYVTLTWNHANALAGSHCDAQAQGLTAQGRDFVRALYAHRMLPDVSHLSEAAAWDVVRLGLGPVIASHANSRAVCAHTRNVSDDLFRAIRDSGGVVGLNLYTDFLGGGMDAVVPTSSICSTSAATGRSRSAATSTGAIRSAAASPACRTTQSSMRPSKPAAMTPRCCRISSPTTGCACCRNNGNIQYPAAETCGGAFFSIRISYSSGLKSDFGWWHSGQTKSSGISAPSYT